MADPAQIQQYNGTKRADDQHDASHLAELQRLNIQPKAHIYDATLQLVRDLFRRRTNLVHQRTALMLSFKSLYTRTTGQSLALNDVKQLTPNEAVALYEHSSNQLIARVQVEQMAALRANISGVEKAVLACAREIPLYDGLLTIPWIGKILGTTITLEVGDIGRFKTDGDFASYYRTVDARRLSNGKSKGENNAKCGNKYLSWAFVEAANFAKRYNDSCWRCYDRKAAKTNSLLATKALACKLAKAAWHLMAQHTNFDAKRMFAELAMKRI